MQGVAYQKAGCYVLTLILAAQDCAPCDHYAGDAGDNQRVGEEDGLLRGYCGACCGIWALGAYLGSRSAEGLSRGSDHTHCAACGVPRARVVRARSGAATWRGEAASIRGLLAGLRLQQEQVSALRSAAMCLPGGRT